MILQRGRRGCCRGGGGGLWLARLLSSSGRGPAPHPAGSRVTAAFTTSRQPPSSGGDNSKRPSPQPGLSSAALLKTLLHKDKEPDPDPPQPDDPSLSPATQAPKRQGLKHYLVLGVPTYLGLWLVTCGSLYTAVKTNSLDTQALFGMDASYAVEKVVSSIEWYTGHRLPEETIADPEVNAVLLAASITKLTSPFRLLATMLLINRPNPPAAAPPRK